MENLLLIGSLVLGVLIQIVDFFWAHILEFIGLFILFMILKALDNISSSIDHLNDKENLNQYKLSQIEQHIRNMDERAAREEQKTVIPHTKVTGH